jgi:hypothetical protein
LRRYESAGEDGFYFLPCLSVQESVNWHMKILFGWTAQCPVNNHEIFLSLVLHMLAITLLSHMENLAGFIY